MGAVKKMKLVKSNVLDITGLEKHLNRWCKGNPAKNEISAAFRIFDGKLKLEITISSDIRNTFSTGTLFSVYFSSENQREVYLIAGDTGYKAIKNQRGHSSLVRFGWPKNRWKPDAKDIGCIRKVDFELFDNAIKVIL